ncbi:MAG: methyl-accepting chemotaxis protein [Pseudomonadota bacterium]
MRLSNWKIRNKLLLLVGVMALLIAVVSGVGLVAVRDIVDQQQIMDENDTEALLSANLNQNVIALNRAEYRVGGDPSANTLNDVLDTVSKERKSLEDHLGKLRETADGEQMDMLKAIEADYEAYTGNLNDTLAKAREVGSSVVLSDAQRNIQESVKASQAAADRLQQTVKAYADYSDRKSNEATATATKTASSVQAVMIVVSILGIVGGIALGYLLATFGIAKPLARSIANLRQLADGDLSAEVFGTERKDEIGDIASALQVFKDTAVKAETMRAEQAKEQERKEARQRAIDGYIESFDESVTGLLGVLASAATEMRSTAESMSATAEETSRQATAVAAASEQASTNVQTVASAAEELANSITEIGRRVSESTRIANQAVNEATRTNAEVKGLAEAAEKIGNIVELINDIASQTNLLALNATIEAARAGEAGKGFAVVASEVKSLANQTAKATEEIANQINAMQSATNGAVGAIEGIGGTINKISEIATAIASAVEEQGAATQEIARNVQQAAAGTAEVSSNVAGVTQAASETGAASGQVRATAGELAKQAEVLRAEVDRFLDNIRAA